jgi:hypothetical protein
MSDPSFAVGVEVAVDEQLVGVSTSGHAHVHLSVGEDVFVEKEADPFQGEAETGGKPGERRALGGACQCRRATSTCAQPGLPTVQYDPDIHSTM